MGFAIDHIWDALRQRIEAKHNAVAIARDTNGDLVAFARSWDDLRDAGLVRHGTYRETLVSESLNLTHVFSDQYELVYPGDSDYVTGATGPTVYSTEAMYVWDTPECELVSNGHDMVLAFTYDAPTDEMLDGLRDLFGDDNPAQTVNSALLAKHFKSIVTVMDLPCDKYGQIDPSSLPDGSLAIPDPNPTPSFYVGDRERSALVVDLSYGDDD